MKNYIFHLLTLVTMLAGSMPMAAQSQDNALYVYRNDGDFNAFLREDLDSIVLSHYDTDSVYQKDCVTQVFYTADSIYIIPIAAIDSVSFVPLPTIVNSMVFPLTAEHDPYILRGDTLSFELNVSTPASMLPSVGNVVVSAVDCNAFENGIIGRVTSVDTRNDGIYYNCEKAYIDDIYDQLIYHGPMQMQSESSDTRAITIEGEVKKLLWNKEYEKTLESSGTTTNFKASDAAAVSITLRKTIGQPMYAKVQLENRFESSVVFNAESSYSNYYQKQLGNTLRVGRICIPNFPLIWFTPTFDFYGYFTDEGKVSLDFSAHLNRYDKVFLTYSDGQWDYGYAPKTDAGVDVASLSMKGYAEVGVITEMLLGLCGSRTGIGVSAEVGLKESIDFEFDAKEYVGSGLYDALKNSYARTTMPWQISVFAQAGLWDSRTPRASFTPLKQEPQLGTDKYLLPEFTEPTYTVGANKTMVALSTNPSRDLLIPVGLGIGVETEDGDEVETKWSSVEYKNESEWTLNGISETFDGLSAGKTYKAYPYVRIIGQELRATPETDFALEVTVNTLEATNVKATSATLNGNVSGIDLSNTSNVTVGFLHGTSSDLQIGNSSFVSCAAGEKFSYTLSGLTANTQYYYRACVVVNSTEYYGSVQSLTTKELEPTPGEAIDLGLSVKWASHNVGASSPEEYGGYYAWGETEEKSYYDFFTYTYAYQDSTTGECMNIGSDIAGTNYDVAYVKWGGTWRMPNMAQCQELWAKCTWTSITYNGVEGILVTGPNGNSIFLPAAGCRYCTSIYYVGLEGFYWGSTAKENDTLEACILSNCWWYPRCLGLSVRPVTE